MKKYILWSVTALIIMSVPCRAEVSADTAASLSYMTEEFKPYNYREYGQTKGLSVDLLKLMWREMGMQEQPIKFMPWPRAYEMVLNEPGHVLFAMLKTPQRAPLFKWVGPIALSKTYLIAKKDSQIHMDSIEDAQGLTVGVVRDYASADLLAKYKDMIRTDTVNSLELAIKKLDSGRVDLIALEERAYLRTLKAMRASPEKFKNIWLLNESASFYALSKNTPDSLVDQLQQACDAVTKKPQYKELIEHYLK